MKRKKGFIAIIVLVTMPILLTMALYVVNISKNEHLILNSGDNKASSYYQSEGKIHLALYDDKYYISQLYMNIIDVFRTNNFGTLSKKVIIDEEDLDFGDDIKDIWLEFIDKDNRIIMNIIASSNINGVKSGVTSSGPIVNELFEIDNSILSLNLIEEIHRNNLQELLETINKNISIHNCYKNQSIFGAEFENFNKVILNKKNSSRYEISSKRRGMRNPSVESFVENEIFIIAKGTENEKTEFFIGDPDDVGSNIKLSGIIFVDGDLIISDDFDFKGIIIVKNGQIINDSMKKCKIEGLLIIENIENYDDFIKNNDIVMSRHLIYKYGTYLPGFLDPKISVIKGI